MAGTVSQQLVNVSPRAALIIFTCTADAADATIPDTAIEDEIINEFQGDYIVDVITFPTPGGTAPDAADLTLQTKTIPTRTSTLTPANPRNVLGTAGTNLIHATNEQNMGDNMTYELITGNYEISVANQGTNSAEFTIVLKISRNQGS